MPSNKNSVSLKLFIPMKLFIQTSSSAFQWMVSKNKKINFWKIFEKGARRQHPHADKSKHFGGCSPKK